MRVWKYYIEVSMGTPLVIALFAAQTFLWVGVGGVWAITVYHPEVLELIETEWIVFMEAEWGELASMAADSLVRELCAYVGMFLGGIVGSFLSLCALDLDSGLWQERVDDSKVWRDRSLHRQSLREERRAVFSQAREALRSRLRSHIRGPVPRATPAEMSDGRRFRVRMV